MTDEKRRFIFLSLLLLYVFIIFGLLAAGIYATNAHFLKDRSAEFQRKVEPNFTTTRTLLNTN